MSNDWPAGFVLMMRDDTAPHQIRIGMSSRGGLYRSCTCCAHPYLNGIYGGVPLEFINGVPIEDVLERHRLHVAEATAA